MLPPPKRVIIASLGCAAHYHGPALRSRVAAEIAPSAHTAPSHPAPVAPAPVAALLVHCTPQPAPCCAAEPKSLPPSSLLVAARGSGAAPLQHAMHAMHTARSSAVAACSTRSHLPRSPPPHPLARRTLRHTNPGDTSPVMSLPDCGVPHEHIPPSTLVLCQCRFISTHVVHPPPQAIVMAATATHHTLPILVHCNALLHTATPQCRLPTTRLGVPQLRRCGPCRI